MKEHGVEFIQGLLLAFACMVILMPPYLRLPALAAAWASRSARTGPELTWSSRGRPRWAASSSSSSSWPSPTSSSALRRIDVLAALRPGACRRAGGGGRLPQRPDGHRHPRPPEDPLAAGRGHRRGDLHPEPLQLQRRPRAVHRRRGVHDDRHAAVRGLPARSWRGGLHRPGRDRHRGRQQRREPHRRSRRPGRRHARLRLHQLPDHLRC